MGQIYFLIFWVPAIASAIMLLAASLAGSVSRPGRLAAWFSVALALQLVAGLFSPLWVIGLILQVVLGIYLAIQSKLN